MRIDYQVACGNWQGKKEKMKISWMQSMLKTNNCSNSEAQEIGDASTGKPNSSKKTYT